MKIKLYKVHDRKNNKWFSFKDIDKMKRFLSRPLNTINDYKIYIEYEPVKRFEQIKFEI